MSQLSRYVEKWLAGCDLEDGEGRLVARATSVCAIRQEA